MNGLKKISVIFAALAMSAVSLAGCFVNAPQKVEEEYKTTLPVVFSLNDEKTPISPYIYGQFIEHIETCIYDGIWSEMVLDRKFYYEVGQSGLSPWKASNPDGVSCDENVTLSGGHSAKISSGSGIYQDNMSYDEKKYDGYFWCKSDSGCKVKITLSRGTKSVSAEVSVPANSAFCKYDYSLNSDFKALETGKYSFEVLSGEGRFDSLSLMPSDNYKGMRKDTLDKLKELGSPMYRWPGGNFLSGYDWEDGVGDIDKRPSRRNLHYMGRESDFDSEDAQIASDMIKLNQLGFYGGIEPNDFGLDEFMAMCEYLGAEPMMMVNTGLGNAVQAANQVEYCNGSAKTKMGEMRARNGHAAPYSIKYWGVGNEMFGSWQLGHTSLVNYAIRHNLFVKAMKAVDSGISIIASGENSSDWSDGMFLLCNDNFDFIAEHMYGLRDETNVFNHIKNIKTNLETRIKNHRELLGKYSRMSDVKIAFTEYAYDKAECPSRLKDGMGIAAFLNSVINNADVFEVCCYSSTTNATQGCITTEPFGAVMQGAGYSLKLYRRYMQGYSIGSSVKYDERLQIDVSLSVSEDGKTLSLAVVNPSNYSVRLNNSTIQNAKSIERHSFLGDYPDSYDSVSRSELYEEHVKDITNVVAPASSVSVFVIGL